MYRNKRSGKKYDNRNYRSHGNVNRFQRIKSFDPTTYIINSSYTNVNSEEIEIVNTFEDFKISENLKASIRNRGYKIPTPIQDQAIPALLEGRNVVGIAATGTDKTAAYLIPLIDKILKNRLDKALIVTPTRELAIQVEKEIKDFTKEFNINSVNCIGGDSIKGQIHTLRRNPNFVVGTPGRLLDLGERREIDFKSFNNIVLDEVDRMLDMGFIKDITFIVSRLKNERQSLFFSATLPPKVKEVMKRFLNNPVIITINKQIPAENIKQDIVKINGREKQTVLFELLNKQELEKVLVFGRTKRSIEELGRALVRDGIQAATIHGNKTQNQRRRTLEQFRNDNVQVLLATDVASRGLDINNITHVINYDLPQTFEDYIHRIGRTGRANKTGVALTFVN